MHELLLQGLLNKKNCFTPVFPDVFATDQLLLNEKHLE